MVLLRHSGIFSTFLLAASLSLPCATTQDDASSSLSPHTIQDVPTIGTSAVDGVDTNGIEDSGGRLVVIPFTLTANGQRGLPRMVWTSSPLLRALSPDLTTESGSPEVEESFAWPSSTVALYRGLMDRAERARALQEEAVADDSGSWSPDGIWPVPRDNEGDAVYYEDDGDEDQASSAEEEEEPDLADYDGAEDPAEENMQTAENIMFRPMFRYKQQQAAKRRNYRSKATRRRYRPRRRHYSKRKYRPHYNYNYYYPYNYYGYYRPSQV